MRPRVSHTRFQARGTTIRTFALAVLALVAGWASAGVVPAPAWVVAYGYGRGPDSRGRLGHLGSLWGRRAARSRISRGVREPRKKSSGGKSGGGADPRVLTSQITKAETVSSLISILQEHVDSPIFNDFHMGAALSSLARFKQGGKLRAEEARSPVLPRLQSSLLKMISQRQLPVRAVANIFWAMSILADAIPTKKELMPGLVQAAGEKARSMNALDVSNCIVASAKLASDRPVVLTAVPKVSARLPQVVFDLKPQELANCLWGAAKLKDATPEMLTAVPILAKRIADRAVDMENTGLSNCLWACAMLQDEVPEVLEAVASVAENIPRHVGSMAPQALSNCLWASAKLQGKELSVLTAVPAIVQLMLSQVPRLNEQDVSNSFWAAAELREGAPEVLQLIPDLRARVPGMLPTMKPPGLYMCFAAAAKLGEQALQSRVEAELEKRQRGAQGL